MRAIWFTVLAVVLVGCSAFQPTPGASAQDSGAASEDRPSGEMFLLKHGVWPEFKRFRAQLVPGRDEYFATATDGAWAWEFTEQKALDLCQDHSTGPKCILFAKNAKILVPYRLN